MSKKKDQEIKGDQRLENIEGTLSRTEQFIVDNQKYISVVVGVIVVLILAFFGFQRYYLQPKTVDAQEQMFMAQKYFESDSLDRALYGDGNSLGFIDIADEYSFTKPGKLSNYYAGICFLQKGDYKKAIEYLESFDSDDHMVGPMATGAIGDAYMELGESDKAITYYLEAAGQDDNDFTTPLFLLKAGQVYELTENYDEALDVYNRIKDDYKMSNEGRSIEKYIARAEAKSERN
ncbi:MAG: tetratricopeptide repeat protein [Bacteroidetes bacterium]|nr:MAG: tetratricopeptide repeat protein [Bacteroidota bacterium]RLD87542.1 MAG: tetratricopeptide repeat protein [Bacteroidota bacterium]